MERCNTIGMSIFHVNDFSYCILINNSVHIDIKPHGKIIAKCIKEWS
jgi:hypothetical protein